MFIKFFCFFFFYFFFCRWNVHHGIMSIHRQHDEASASGSWLCSSKSQVRNIQHVQRTKNSVVVANGQYKSVLSADFPKGQACRFESFDVEIPMQKLPSGHRTIPLISWSNQEARFPVPEQLQEQYGLSQDAFNLNSGSPFRYMEKSAPSVMRTEDEDSSTDARAGIASRNESHQSASQANTWVGSTEELRPRQPRFQAEMSQPTPMARAQVQPKHSASLPFTAGIANSSGPESHGSRHGQADGEMASHCDPSPHRPGEQPPDVLQASPGGEDQEGQARATTLCDSAGECRGNLSTSCHKDPEAGEPVGIMASLRTLRCSNRICQQATSQGEEQGQEQTARAPVQRGVHSRNFIHNASLNDECPSATGAAESEPYGSARLLRHDADLHAGHPGTECCPPGVSSGTEPDLDDDARRQVHQRQLHGSGESAGAAAGPGNHGGGFGRRVGPSEPQCHRGPRTTTMSWPLLFTTSLLSMSTVLGWDQCSSELRTKVSLPAHVRPEWVLLEEVLEDQNDLRMWQPLDRSWPRMTPGLTGAVRCTRGHYSPAG